MEPYDGTADPIDHLDNFCTLMYLQGASDVFLFRAFSSTLRKVARHWYSNIQPEFMDSFNQLSRLFVATLMVDHSRLKSKRRKRTTGVCNIGARNNDLVVHGLHPEMIDLHLLNLDADQGHLLESFTIIFPSILLRLKS